MREHSSAAAEPAPAQDMPVRGSSTRLVPNLLPSAAHSDAMGGGSEDDRGTTIQNDGSSRGPTAAQSAKRAGLQVTRWLQRDAAERRASSGAVGPYFVRMRQALEKQTASLPIGLRGINGAGAARAKAAQRYGATSQIAPPTATVGERPPPTLESETTTGSNNESIVRALSPLTTSNEEAGHEAARAFPLATIEILQDESGGLISTTLDNGSGNARFDGHVLAAVPIALRELDPPERGAAGVRPEGIRTLWTFEGLPAGSAVRCRVRLVAVF